MQTIVVTGASSGIGKAVALAFGRLGFRLGLIARDFDRLSKTKTEVEDLGGQADIFVCDLEHSTQIRYLISSIKNTYSTLDALVNVAGIGLYHGFRDITETEWEKSFNLNVKAPLLLAQGLLPLLENHPSLVLNIGSKAGIKPAMGRSIYCGTKFALRGMTLSLAEEFKDQYPRFSLLTLGSTLTSFGGISIADKRQKIALGLPCLLVEDVADQVVDIFTSGRWLPECEYNSKPVFHQQ